MRNTNAHRPAAGIRTTRKPRAASRDWINATPRMPVVTLRTVAPASASYSAPLLPKRWFANFLEICAPWPALARRNPATRIETKNCSTLRPTPAAAERSPLAASLRCGARLRSAAGRLLEASLQRSLNGLPTIGQVAIVGGGGGIVRASLSNPDPRDWNQT